MYERLALHDEHCSQRFPGRCGDERKGFVRMRQSFRLLAALCGVLMAAASASADPVLFKTEFDFNPSTSAIDNTLILTDGASLTLTGTNVFANTPQSGVTFGTLSFDPKDSAGTIGVDQDFIMKVTLISPSAGSSDVTSANFWGSVNSKSATLSLTGGSVVLAGFKFTLDSTDVGLFAGAFSSTPVTGSVVAAPASVVSAVPVPMAVWGGISLLGILGGGQIWKRRRHLA
jgi:hypothetical protein